jgi:hypothetical protein
VIFFISTSGSELLLWMYSIEEESDDLSSGDFVKQRLDLCCTM